MDVMNKNDQVKRKKYDNEYLIPHLHKVILFIKMFTVLFLSVLKFLYDF